MGKTVTKNDIQAVTHKLKLSGYYFDVLTPFDDYLAFNFHHVESSSWCQLHFHTFVTGTGEKECIRIVKIKTQYFKLSEYYEEK